MCKKSLLMMLLLALLVPWAAKAQESTPYTEGFENMSTASDLTAAGWISYQSHSGSFLAIDETSSNVHTGTKALKIDSWNAGSNSDYVILGLPTVDAAINTLQITFSYRISSTSGGNMEVGYLTNVDDASTFVSLQTCANSTSYVTETVELNGAPNDAARIAIKYIGYYRCYVDDFEVKTLPTCPKPTGLNFALTPGDGTVATLSWTSDADAWQICLNGDETNLIAATTNPYTLTGLTPETTYTAKVRTNCGSEQSDWSNEVTFTPTDAYTLTVNDGTTTNGYVPFYGYYADSDANSQFIIPADGLSAMTWGTIEKLTFYTSTGTAAWDGAVFDIYFSEVDYSAFETAALIDWSELSVKVYTGTVSVANNKMELTLTTPYNYMGGNLLIGFDETSNSSDYPSAPWYGVTQTNNTAVYKYSSYNAVLAKFLPKVTFGYTPGEEPACMWPTNLAAGTPGPRSVELSWTENGTATNWQICVNGDEANPIAANTNPYTLTGLTPETDYTVKVRSNCGTDGYSDWSNEVSFTTDVSCPAPKNLNVNDITAYTAHVSWLSNAEMYDLRYTPIPVDRGSASHSNLADVVTLNSTSSSNYQLGEASSAQPNGNTRVEQLRNGWYNYDNGTFSGNIGTSGGQYFWAVMFPAETYTETAVTKVSLFDIMAMEGTVYVCESDSTDAPGTIKGSKDITLTGAAEFVEFEFDSPVVIDPSKNLWIVVFNESGATFPTACCANTGDPNGRWISMDGETWNDILDIAPSLDYTWMLRAYLINFDPSTMDWTEVYNIRELSYDLTGLTPETEYIVQVRANCGDDGYSEWTSKLFTTEPTCVMPTDLDVTDFTAHTATLSWTDPNGATAWDVEVTNNDEWPAIVTTWNATTNPYTLNGLQDNTHYSVKVRAKCSDTDFSDWSETVTFVTDIACIAPDSLMVIDSTITAFSAHLTWVSEAETTDLRYMVNAGNTGESWLSYDNGTYATNIGSSAGDSRTWAVMYPASMLGSNNTLTMLSIFEDSYIQSDITVRIYQGGDTIPELQIYREIISPVGGSFFGFHDVALSEAVTIDPSKNLWISLTATGPYVIPACESTEINNKWLYNAANGWYPITGSLADYGWMIRAGFATMNWVNVPGLTENEYELTELLPETDYIAQVRSNCDVEGHSTWASVEFTTLPSCWTPTNVVVSGVEYTQAVVDWTPNTNGTETAWQIELADDQEPPVVTIYDVTAHPDTLRGLFDDTEYTVRVRAICGEDNYSDWTSAVTFTTLSLCEAPEIDSVTNIAARTASVYWTGIQEKYNVRYGVEADPTIFLNVDFEDGVIPATWTNDATYPWTVETDTVTGKQYMKSSNGGVSSSTSVITATATFTDAGFISFDALCMGEGTSSYWDHCDFYIDGTRVLYAGANISGWNNYKFAVAAGEHTFKWSYTKDSSVNPTGDYFAVDNVVMGLTTYEWTIVENIEGNTYGLTGLTPETEYVVQVQGICPRGNTEWSEEMVVFETEPSCIAPTEVIVSNIEAYQAVIDWTANSEETAWEIEVSDKSQTPPTITTWPATEHPFTLPGLFDDTDYEVRVRANCGEYDGYSDWSEPVTFTTLSHCLAPVIGEITDITATSATVNWTGHANAYDLMYAVNNSDIYLSENFENDTIVPATLTNDATYPWTIETGNGGHVMKSGNAGVSSSTSAVSVTVTYTVDGIVKFDAECRGEGTSTAYDKCIFEIDGVAQFTYGAHVTNDGWLHYSFDVAAGEHTFTWKYSKDSSVNPTGDYFAVDNIVMEYADITWAPMIANIADTTYTLTNLEPGTEYIVKVRGADCDSISWSNEVAFTTLEQTTVTQTIALSEGWNWVSFYVEADDLLEQLEESLGENGLYIWSNNGSIEYDADWGWDGDELEITNEETYLIQTSADCTIQLQGLPANPTEHKIYINPGWNWIGYPNTEVTSIEDALVNFDAEEGDQLWNSEGSSEYDVWGWDGDVMEFVPNQGYMYYSVSSDVKPLVFATGAAKARKIAPSAKAIQLKEQKATKE